MKKFVAWNSMGTVGLPNADQSTAPRKIKPLIRTIFPIARFFCVGNT